MQRKTFALLVATVWCCVMFTGCGTSDPLGRQAISGEVNVDGQPLKDGSISFEPIEKSVTSSGAMIQEGKYAIIREQGLPPGKYRVVVNALKPGTGMTLPEGKMPGEEVGTPPEELIPPEWNTDSKNTIEVTPSGDNHFMHDIVTKK
ncbi:MAG: hypothetical protein AB7O38_15645 [Pirellulaceae bacterium]